MFVLKGCAKQTINIVGNFPAEVCLGAFGRSILQKCQNLLPASFGSSKLLLRYRLPTAGLKAKIRSKNEHSHICLVDLGHAGLLGGIRPCAEVLAHHWSMTEQ